MCIESIDHEYRSVHITKYKVWKEIIPVADSLLPSPDQQSRQHLLNILCDDVLRMIFESSINDHRFDLKQLVAIANVCTRFRRIAADIFTAKYKGNINFDHLSVNPAWVEFELLRAFGRLISEISFSGICTSTLDMVSKYCQNIKGIKCLIKDQGLFYRECILPQRLCPKLVNLHLSTMHFYDLRATETFFILNPQLEQLTLDNIGMPFDLDFLRHLPNLKVLVLHSQCVRYQSFGQLRYLKSLHLRSEDIQRILNELIAGNVQLERLDLSGEHDNSIEIVNLICQMKSINWLQVNSIDDRSLTRIIESLEHLSEIAIDLSTVTIKGIRHALEHSTHLTKARIHSIPIDDTIDGGDINAIDEMRRNRPIDLSINIEIYEHLIEVSITICPNEQFILNNQYSEYDILISTEL